MALSNIEQVRNQALLRHTSISPAANSPAGFNISSTLKEKIKEFARGKYYLNKTSPIKY